MHFNISGVEFLEMKSFRVECRHHLDQCVIVPARTIHMDWVIARIACVSLDYYGILSPITVTKSRHWSLVEVYISRCCHIGYNLVPSCAF